MEKRLFSRPFIHMDWLMQTTQKVFLEYIKGF